MKKVISRNRNSKHVLRSSRDTWTFIARNSVFLMFLAIEFYCFAKENRRLLDPDCRDPLRVEKIPRVMVETKK